MRHISIPVITVVALTGFSTLAAPPEIPSNPSKLPPASTQVGLTFDKDVHPIFADACVRCHGEQRPKAALRLDTLDGVLKGSKDHKEVVPGQSDKSRLVFAVATVDGKVFMPPKPRQRPNPPPGATNAPPAPPANAHPWKPLTTEQVGLIRAWIDQGAK
jgi:hypothetical protein